jgi:NAD(P)H-hydrate epimerase
MTGAKDVRRVEQLPALPARRPDSHKGDFGRVLIVAGSQGMSGAACLAGAAALRGGAGLVRVAVPAKVWPIVAAFEPSYLTWPLPDDGEGRIDAAALTKLLELADANDALAIGPGLGQTPGVSRMVKGLIGAVRKPTILDADALNALGGQPDQLTGLGPLAIITPHPGEFARLVGSDTKSVQSRRAEAAADLARRHGVVVVLKGHGTVVTDGENLYINRTGNPGMATGGSGDVLTGLVVAFAGQGLTPLDAAVLAVHVHGLAGDLAARELGQTALVASDLLRYLPAALRTVPPLSAPV